MIITNMPSHQVAYFKELFQTIDKENDGNITSKELGVVAAALKVHCTDMDIQNLINGGDLDGNGNIEFEEFVEVIAQKLMVEANIEEYREVFNFFDKDRNGFITSSELGKIYLALGFKISDDELQEIIHDADNDTDNVINFEEFVNMMTTIQD